MTSCSLVFFFWAMSMGFPADSCREALNRCYGDVQRAINMLVSCGGVLSPLPALNQGTNHNISTTTLLLIIRAVFN